MSPFDGGCTAFPDASHPEVLRSPSSVVGIRQNAVPSKRSTLSHTEY